MVAGPSREIEGTVTMGGNVWRIEMRDESHGSYGENKSIYRRELV